MAGVSRIINGIILLAFVCRLYLVSAEDSQYLFSVSYQPSGSIVVRENWNRCLFRGRALYHRQKFFLDGCTRCKCWNGTTTCRHLDLDCRLNLRCDESEAVIIPQECCPQCPYELVVKQTSILLFRSFRFTEDDIRKADFVLEVTVDTHSSSGNVRGINLWKLSAWISPNKDGSGVRFSYADDVFDMNASSIAYYQRSDYHLYWSDIQHTFIFKGGTCDDYKYFCVRFGRGTNPRPLYNLTLTLQSVNNEKDRLIDCRPLGKCQERIRTCNYKGRTIKDGTTFRSDKCTTCHCLNTVLQCTEETCVISDCAEGTVVEDECCPVYPYRLYVTKTTILHDYNTTFRVGWGTMNVTFGLSLTIDQTKTSRFIRGTHLWKLTSWITSRKNGLKKQIVETLFSDEDSSKSYQQNEGNPTIMEWESLTYEIDLNIGNCDDFASFCVEFGREVAPSPRYGLELSVSSDYTDELVDCKTIGFCEEDTVIDIKTGLIDVNILIIIIIFVSLIMILMLCFTFILLRRRQKTNNPIKSNDGNDPTQHNVNTREMEPLLKGKEIHFSQVRLEHEIGKGEFGVVFQGVVTGLAGKPDPMTVAVKTIKGLPWINKRQQKQEWKEIQEDFFDEMMLLASLGEHRNILSLVACCSCRDHMYIITHFMKYGDLLGFLRKCREEDSPNVDPVYSFAEKQQMIVAREIANGMAYLEAEKISHGDLAARNILVGEGLSIKISDFGMSDDIYSRGYKRREEVGRKIPVKWCSPETIFSGICSSKSDVWSFGIVLYEIFTLGGTPYPGMTLTYFVSKLKDGYRMEKAESCPDDIYNVMVKCWQQEPHERPGFSTLIEDLGELLNKRSDYVQFTIDNEAINCGHGAPSATCKVLHQIENDEGEADMVELIEIVNAHKEKTSPQSVENSRHESVEIYTKL